MSRVIECLAHIHQIGFAYHASDFMMQSMEEIPSHIAVLKLKEKYISSAMALIGTPVAKRFETFGIFGDNVQEIQGMVRAYQHGWWEIYYPLQNECEYVQYLDLVDLACNDVSNFKNKQFIEILGTGILENPLVARLLSHHIK